jgi:chloride channel 7
VFFGPLSHALRVTIHLGELDPPAGVSPAAFAAAIAPRPGTLLTWALILWPLTALTFGIGAATGVFVPSLATGAAVGRLVGQASQAALTAFGSTAAVSLPSYAVVGAAAALGGVTRMTFSAVVLVMEGAGALQLVVPLALAVTAARVAGDAWGPSIYDVHVRIRGTPVLSEPGTDARQRMAADKLSVGELAATEVTALPPILRVADAVAALRSTAHGSFPISPNTGGAAREGGAFELHGVLARATLVRLLEGRVRLFAWEAGEGGSVASTPSSAASPARPPLPPAADRVPSTQAARLDLLARLQQRPLKVRRGEEGAILDGITSAECDLWLDVRPYMRRCPFVLQVRVGYEMERDESGGSEEAGAKPHPFNTSPSIH